MVPQRYRERHRGDPPGEHADVELDLREMNRVTRGTVGASTDNIEPPVGEHHRVIPHRGGKGAGLGPGVDGVAIGHPCHPEICNTGASRIPTRNEHAPALHGHGEIGKRARQLGAFIEPTVSLHHFGRECRTGDRGRVVVDPRSKPTRVVDDGPPVNRRGPDQCEDRCGCKRDDPTASDAKCRGPVRMSAHGCLPDRNETDGSTRRGTDVKRCAWQGVGFEEHKPGCRNGAWGIVSTPLGQAGAKTGPGPRTRRGSRTESPHHTIPASPAPRDQAPSTSNESHMTIMSAARLRVQVWHRWTQQFGQYAKVLDSAWSHHTSITCATGLVTRPPELRGLTASVVTLMWRLPWNSSF